MGTYVTVMGGKLILLLIITWAALIKGQDGGGPKHGKKIVCYHASWGFYRKEPLKFYSTDFDPSLCTHLIYSFALLDEKTNGIISSDKKLDIDNSDKQVGYKGFVDLKKQHPHLKVMLCIGGWNEGSAKYSKLAANPQSRKQFILSVITYLQTHKFDGLDVMWKYPTTRGGVEQDKENFAILIKELKEAFQPHNFILTAALGGIKHVMKSAYDLVKLNQYLDLIHVLGYDYHGPWHGIVGSNAPLNGTSEYDLRSVEYTIRYMIAFGVSPQKMVLGLPLFGRTFLLNDPKVNPIIFGGTTVQGVGFPGPIIKGINYYAYSEVCMELTNKTVPWEYNWDEQSSTPYLRDKDRIISYDNPRSIANKVKLAIDYNLGGFMVWSVDTDDFKGLCHLPNDTYQDYDARLKRMTQHLALQDALDKLDLTELGLSNSSYVMLNNKLVFVPPKQDFKNYQLMRTINQATSVALDEMKIIQRFWKAKGVVREVMATSSLIPKDIGTCVDNCRSSCIKVCQQPFL